MPQVKLLVIGRVDNREIKSVREEIVGVQGIYDRTPVESITDKALASLQAHYAQALRQLVETEADMDGLEDIYGTMLAGIIKAKYGFVVNDYYLVFSIEAADAVMMPLFPGGREYVFHRMLQHISRSPNGYRGTAVVYDGHAMLSGVDFFHDSTFDISS